MNFSWVDWSLVAVMLLFITALAIIAQRYTKSVADFLSANRCGGRYILALSEGSANLGAISIIAWWEMYYEAGFTPTWWIIMSSVTFMIIATSGFVMYRFRETRAMTLGQFFELRYSRKFRIFAGLLAFLCGVMNFGIFPAVGAQFFMYFTGMPDCFVMFGFSLPTFHFMMAVLLLLSVVFTCLGGQISVIISDFFQSIICFVVFLIITFVLFSLVNWHQVETAVLSVPSGKSMVNPFQGKNLENFNFWYFFICAVGMFYSCMCWQGSQGYRCAAKSPHESKMANIVGGWRFYAVQHILMLMAIFAFVLLNNIEFGEIAKNIKNGVAQIPNSHVRNQMLVPMTLAFVLPLGLKGALAAAILSTFISTHVAYLHSWGSIFIQDVLIPFRSQPFTPRQHIWLLRWSILGVAVFIFLFSCIYNSTQSILMPTSKVISGGFAAH